MNKRSISVLRKLVIVLLCLAWPALSPAQQGGRTTYVYDDNGRLIAVVLPTGDAVTYEYDAAGNLVAVKRGAYTKVSIVEFTPESGTEGTTVTIFGTGFSNSPGFNTVTFNGAAAVVTSASATQLVVTVPATATTGPITVVTTNGTAVSTAPFIISAVPVINSFTPLIGAPGDSVTITGTDFATNTSDNVVKFNGFTATNIAASTTEIETTVPEGATSGRISLTTSGGTAQSTDDFFVPPPGYVAANVDDTGRVALGETEIVTINNPNNIGLVVFDATAGQSIGVELSDVTLFSGMLTLFNPDGSQVDAVFLDQGFIDTLPLTQTGTYTIMVTSFDATGSVTVALNDTTETTGTIIPDGPPVTVSIIIPGRNGRLSFDGTAGQRIFLQGTNIQFGGTPRVYIFNPDGTILAQEHMGGFIGEGFNDIIDTRTLPVTGKYSILIDPNGFDVGELTLNLYNVPPDVQATLVPDGPIVPITIGARGQNARLTFTATAGQRLLVRTSDSTFGFGGIWTKLLAPDGTLLNWALTSSDGFFETEPLPVDGTYTVELDPPGATIGSISAKLEARPPDVTDTITIGGPPVTKTTTLPGQNIVLSFTANPGQKVSIKLNNLPNTDFFGTHYLFLYRPDGTFIFGTFIGNNQTFFADTTELTEGGTYKILVDLSGDIVGSATVTLFDASDVEATLIADGPPVTATVTSPGQNAVFNFEGTVGQWLQVNIDNQSIPLPTLIDVLRPDGQSQSFIRLGQRLLIFPLTQGGTHKVVVNPSGQNIGSITMRLFQDPPAEPIEIGGPTVTLTTSPASFRPRVSFQGTAGQRISVSGTNNTIQFGQLIVFAEDGTLLRSGGMNQGSTWIEGIVLPTTGIYYIQANGFSSFPSGSADVAVLETPESEITASTTIDGEQVTLTTTVPAENAAVTFTGTAGKQVNIQFEFSPEFANTCFDLRLNGTEGFPIRASFPCSRTVFEMGFITLPSDGTYTIKIDPSGPAVGTIKVKVITSPPPQDTD